MSVLAPKEIQGIPSSETGKIVHLPTQEATWRDRVVENVQRIVPSHTVKQATPHATQPIPPSEDLKKIGAERPGAIEFPTVGDATRNIGHMFNEGGLGENTGVISNPTFAKRVIARAKRKIRELQKAA